MPLIGAYIAVLCFLAMIFSTWLFFPVFWRTNSDFRKRMKYSILAQFFVLGLSVQYWIVGWAFFALPPDYQPVLGILLPVSRELAGFILGKICVHAAGGRNEGVIIIAENMTLTFHALFLAVCVGSSATNATIYILLAIDFSINMFWCVKVFYSIKKGGEEERIKCADALKILVLSESLEFVMPLGYLACFVAAFYGPNADVLGNVKNSYWQYQAVENLERAISNLLLLVSIDLLSLVISLFLLWKFCKINILKVYIYLQKQYGYAFAMQQAYLIDYLFCTIAINCAFDFTLHFDWVFDANLHSNMTFDNFTSMNVFSRFHLYLTDNVNV